LTFILDSAANSRWREAHVFGSSGRPSVRPLTPIPRETMSLDLVKGFQVTKLGLNIHHDSGHCWKGFQGQKSKVKVITRSNAPLRRRHTFRRCGVEAGLLAFCSVDAQCPPSCSCSLYLIIVTPLFDAVTSDSSYLGHSKNYWTELTGINLDAIFWQKHDLTTTWRYRDFDFAVMLSTRMIRMCTLEHPCRQGRCSCYSAGTSYVVYSVHFNVK